MNEIEVESVDSLDARPAPDAAEYVLYGGKGGVGKTTMAAATALASAADGTPTLVVSTDPAHSLSDTLETGVPDEPERVRGDVPLYAVEIDPESALEEAAVFGEDGGLGGLGGLGEMLGAGSGGTDDADAAGAPLGGPMPGADEAAAMQQLLRYLDDDRFERVVVDTAPTGHTLRLLELPELMDSMVGTLVQLRQRFSGMMENVSGMFGDDADPEAGLDDLEVLRERVERLRETLRDPGRTDFRIVTVPEEMSVLEANRLRSRLAEFAIPVSTVVVNRVMEDPAEVAGVDAVEDAGGDGALLAPDLEECAFCARRWEVQQGALREAQELFRGHDVRRVPLFADEVRGERMLRVVAACLA